MRITTFDPKYRDDLIFMVLEAKNALGRIPSINDDLLNIQACYLENGDMFWLALDENDRVIGCIGTRIENDFMWLKRLYVKADFKRQGIGSRLLKVAEQFAVERQVKTIKVHLGTDYLESHSFYPKHAYIEYAPLYMQKQL
jgi:N-acetylglutamate synthase-like GNAT family acetyltransferase